MANEDYDYIPYKDISELKKELEGTKIKKEVSTKDIHTAIQKLSQIMTDLLDVFGAAAEQMKLEDKEYESDAKKHVVMSSKLDKLIEQNRTIAESMVVIADMVKGKLEAPEQENGGFIPLEDKKEDTNPKPKEEQGIFRKSQPEWQPKPIRQRLGPLPTQPQMTQNYVSSKPVPQHTQSSVPPMMSFTPPTIEMPNRPPITSGTRTPIERPMQPPRTNRIGQSYALSREPMPIQPPPMPSTSEPMPNLEFGMPDFGAPSPPVEPESLTDLDFPEEPFPLEEEPKKKGLFGMFKK